MVSHTFTVELVDPCLGTVASTVPPSQQNALINGTPTTLYLLMTDTVSSTYGNADGVSFCGPRFYELTQTQGLGS